MKTLYSYPEIQHLIEQGKAVTVTCHIHAEVTAIQKRPGYDTITATIHLLVGEYAESHTGEGIIKECREHIRHDHPIRLQPFPCAVNTCASQLYAIRSFPAEHIRYLLKIR